MADDPGGGDNHVSFMHANGPLRLSQIRSSGSEVPGDVHENDLLIALYE